MEATKTIKQTVLITGASSGIGWEFARLFARAGYDLVLVARNRPRLEELSRELVSGHEVQVTIIVQDLADRSAPHIIASQLASQKLEIDVLINNAGTQVYGVFAESGMERQLELIQVNLASLVHLTHLLLPGMLQRGRGRILNVGSTGSFAPGPLNAVYCATKAFVVSFSQAIGAELAGTGVTVTAVCPGATRTAFVTRHGMQDVRIFCHAMSPVRVAQVAYRALMQNRPLAVIGLANQLQVIAFQLMAPFLGLTPPAWLWTVSQLFMGRRPTGSLRAQPF